MVIQETMLTSTRPKIESENNRYNVTATSKLLGIYRTTLQKFTEMGLIKVGFLPSGRKFYEGKEILRFWDAQLL